MIRPVLIAALLLGGGYAVRAADDLESSYQSLQDAFAKKDAALVKTLAAKTVELARQAACESEPAAADEKESWKSRVEYANSIESYTEYALYAAAVQEAPKVMVELLSALEEQNAKSKYLDRSYGYYFVSLAKIGAESKVPAIAEKALPNFPENPDLLLVLANTAMNRKQSDRALTLANRLVAAFPKRAKPEGTAAGDWERYRAGSMGRGYWIAGVVSAEKSHYPDADRNLRAALPLIKGDANMTGTALFHLGVANYQLGKMTLNKAKVLEGAQFSEEAAKIPGPLAHQAWLNTMVMKSDAASMR